MCGGISLRIEECDPFARLVAPAVTATTKVVDAAELQQALAHWEPGEPLLIQEFIPEADSEDWYVEAVFDNSPPGGGLLRSETAGLSHRNWGGDAVGVGRELPADRRGLRIRRCYRIFRGVRYGLAL